MSSFPCWQIPLPAQEQHFKVYFKKIARRFVLHDLPVSQELCLIQHTDPILCSFDVTLSVTALVTELEYVKDNRTLLSVLKLGASLKLGAEN